MYGSCRRQEQASPFIPELEKDVEPASLSAITELSDCDVLKDLLVHERRKNVLLFHHNDCVREENESLRRENEKLKFDITNMSFIVNGLNECINLLKERIVDRDKALKREHLPALVDARNEADMRDNRGGKHGADSDVALTLEICTMAETSDTVENLQCRVNVLESELLCKNRIIAGLTRSNEETKSSVSEAAKLAALEEKVRGAHRENKKLYALAKEFEREREEWYASKAIIKEKLVKIEHDQKSLQELAVTLERENLELKRRCEKSSRQKTMEHGT